MLRHDETCDSVAAALFSVRLTVRSLNKTRHPPKKGECLESRTVGLPPIDARYSQLSVP